MYEYIFQANNKTKNIHSELSLYYIGVSFIPKRGHFNRRHIVYIYRKYLKHAHIHLAYFSHSTLGIFQHDVRPVPPVNVLFARHTPFRSTQTTTHFRPSARQTSLYIRRRPKFTTHTAPSRLCSAKQSRPCVCVCVSVSRRRTTAAALGCCHPHQRTRKCCSSSGRSILL